MDFQVVTDPDTEFNERLRMESGWSDVANGLSRVLIGYAMLVLGIVLGATLIGIALSQLGLEFLRRGAGNGKLGYVWMFWIGCSMGGLASVFAFGMVASGQFKCLMHVSERHGARWLMLLCVACWFLGPVFQIATCLAGWQAIQELRNHPNKLHDFQLGTAAHWMQMAAFVVSLLYPLCFCLFLRSIAVCLRVRWNVAAVNIYLLVGAVLGTLSLVAIYQHPMGNSRAAAGPGGLLLNLGWVVLALVYVGIIAVTRLSIGRVISKVRSPFQM